MLDETPVLVVGSGPAGLAAGIELADRGIAPLLVERRASDAANHPRATAISRDGMEMFSRWGLERQVREAGFAADYAMSIRPSLRETEVARVPFPDHVWACAQDHLEPILRARAVAAGACIAYNTELVALRADAARVTATVRDTATGIEKTISARFLVGADGAHGAARRLAGIGQSRRADFGEFMSILFHAPVRDYVANPPCLVYGIGDPSTSGVVVPTDGHDRWIRGLKLHPEAGEGRSSYPDDRCIEIVREAVGVPDLPVTIEHVQPFQMAAALADSFRAGRVVLAGDAAHVFPPTSGMGMNLALADGIALGAQLAQLIQRRGAAPDLDAYEAERRGVVTPYLAEDLQRSHQGVMTA
jgi:putative polyketide hydroxylase